MDPIDINNIKNILPHRYPFLLVDRVLDLDVAEKLIHAVKNVTVNEPYFNGHFPDQPVMPGVLMIEALAQAAGILLDSFLEGDKRAFLSSVDTARFKRMVVPGDQLNLQVKYIRHRGSFYKFDAIATVDGDIACTCELMVSLLPQPI